MLRLEGKVVLVTGSATGIGEGIIRRAAAEGAHVIVHGREEERSNGESIAAELNGLFVSGDLADAVAPARIVAQAVERFGCLDGLVNNAGVSWRGGIEATAEFFDLVMAINARAPFLLIQAAIPHLKQSQGAVVNIGSIHARHGGGNMLPYAMSKAALANLTRTVAGPLAESRVRVNALNLGWTLTPNERQLLIETSDWAPDWPETMNERMPLGRMMLPNDIAAMVSYLLSGEAQMITGQVWDFDQRSHGG